MRLKEGVNITGIRPEIAFIMPVVSRIFADYGAVAVVTSCVDGAHMSNSLHYAGAAIDLRTHDLSPDQIPDVVTALRNALTNDFDVVREPDHIHIEWQPRRPR